MKTVGIDENTHKQLKKIAKENNKDMGEFISAAVTYFQQTGIDPGDEKQSPKKAVEENNKRLNQVIAFIKKQESEHLLPILKKMLENNEILNNYITRLKPETFKTAYTESTNNIKILQQKITGLELQQQKQMKQIDSYSSIMSIMVKLLAFDKGFLGGDKKEREEIKELLQSYVR